MELRRPWSYSLCRIDGTKRRWYSVPARIVLTDEVGWSLPTGWYGNEPSALEGARRNGSGTLR